MKVKANKGFSGFFSMGKPFNMHAGEVREVEDSGTVQELISIGYLEEVDAPESAAETPNAPESATETPNSPEPDEVKPDEDKRGKSKRG